MVYRRRRGRQRRRDHVASGPSRARAQRWRTHPETVSGLHRGSRGATDDAWHGHPRRKSGRPKRLLALPEPLSPAGLVAFWRRAAQPHLRADSPQVPASQRDQRLRFALPGARRALADTAPPRRSSHHLPRAGVAYSGPGCWTDRRSPAG